jgi:hypothetical protein
MMMSIPDVLVVLARKSLPLCEELPGATRSASGAPSVGRSQLADTAARPQRLPNPPTGQTRNDEIQLIETKSDKAPQPIAGGLFADITGQAAGAPAAALPENGS